MMVFLKLLRESVLFAIDALRVNRLRTILSLLGITIGIFTIIAVFTAVDFLKNTVNSSINKLGNNIVYIEKFPWGPEGGEKEYPWWTYLQRPQATLEEYKELKSRVQMGEHVSFSVDIANKTLKYQSNSVQDVGLTAVSAESNKVRTYDFKDGRYFTETESESGRNVCILGAGVAEGLFKDGINPIGKLIKVMGHDVMIVGVLAREGQDVLGISSDNNLFMPVNYARELVDIKSQSVNPSIIVKGAEDLDFTSMMGDVTAGFRSIRKLGPGQKNNFALNNPTIIAMAFQSLSKILDIAGWVIGGFSMLVGGFGIANIMFVSVRERTNIIGIQKSLGAKNYFILLQFLIEAIVLCIMGGVIGLMLVWLGTVLVQFGLHKDFPLNLNNIIAGIGLSVFIGTLAGFWPAWSASRLDPVEAIRA